MARTIGQEGLKLIMQFEGCRLKAYQCAAGVWTIGYGHTAGVKQGQTITQAQAEEYLREDCRKFEQYVNNAVYVPITAQLNQNQFDALVSFAFNCGAGNLKKLCAGRSAAQIAAAMPQYCKAAGRTLAGLVKRRAAETALFQTAVIEEDSAPNSEAAGQMNGETTGQMNSEAAGQMNSGEEQGKSRKDDIEEKEVYSMNTIRRGSRGKAVRVWQIIVGTTPDGIFGSGTESATKNWQTSHGLTADGIVGAKSWKAGLESL